MALSLGNIAIGAEGLYLGNILIGADNITMPPLGPLFVEWIMVGGGGGGGYRADNVDYYRGGGGGAGGVVTGSIMVSSTSSFEITTGLGGDGAPTISDPTLPGGTTEIIIDTVIEYLASGGGRAGTTALGVGNLSGTAGDGGCGGGGASIWSSGGSNTFNGGGGDSVQLSNNGYGWGQDGCNGATSFSTSSGRRGGAGGSGKPTANPGCPNVDSGYTWFDGVEYGRGGDNTTTSAQAAGKGNGGNPNNNGSEGVVVIRYKGLLQRADGGTVTTAGGYTYHTFYTGGSPAFFDNIR
jgi:hypothetical protein